ncbi:MULTISPECIES: cytochrome c [Oleiagrimonas]|jgi:cytochrome c553|uniref:Cytochrome c n=1 Tax=Oleiagrimonas citrea TaxID=1665687 RepID=A0A846ZIL8_9GAMM|nr:MULTISPECIES: cytochrome c [Oleiagrimonas]NKZ37400.1 cytochrome c [Oleiagrimonas citrea]RAP57908.1 cytochrome C [Oleiagrimonas sp. MCCC 1A03011]
MKSVITLSLLVAVLALSAPAAHADGNAAAGMKKATSCFACHGKDGQSIAPNYPRLAGQYQNYMEQALHEYKSGQRKNAIMKGMAAQLSEQDIKDVTAYFSSLPSKLSTLKYHIQGAKEMGASN